MATRQDKVLVVEDNPALTLDIEEKYNCVRASDGWDAIERLENDDYAAIVIDADVPRSSGFGVLTYLREEVGGDFGNVILMSSDRESVQRRVGTTLTVIDKADAARALDRVLKL